MANDFSNVIMTYGAYAHKSMEEIPSNYLKWVSENWDDEDIRDAAEKEYEFRSLWKTHF